MNIEEFYTENEARRSSAEFEFGSEWTDVAGNTYELSWIEDTGELYLMLAPEAEVVEEQLFGDWHVIGEPASALLVKVIASVTKREALESSLMGWELSMDTKGSLSWLSDKFPPAVF